MGGFAVPAVQVHRQEYEVADEDADKVGDDV